MKGDIGITQGAKDIYSTSNSSTPLELSLPPLYSKKLLTNLMKSLSRVESTLLEVVRFVSQIKDTLLSKMTIQFVLESNQTSKKLKMMSQSRLSAIILETLMKFCIWKEEIPLILLESFIIVELPKTNNSKRARSNK